jgi:serine/threonine protein kinase
MSEDVHAIIPCEQGGALCVLSDGVGSARDPRRCSERVVRLVCDHFQARPLEWSLRKTFERLIEEANDSLYREGFYLDGTPSMQATLACVFLSGKTLYGINVGDSPVYLIRNESMECLSECHTVRNGDGKEILTNALGMAETVEPYYFEQEVIEGDVILLTSDGIPSLLTDKMIEESVRRFGSARSLVQEAKKIAQSGDHDDLSAILVEIKQTSPQPRSDAEIKSIPFPQLGKGKLVDGYTLVRSMAGNERVWLAERGGNRFILKFSPIDADRDDGGTIRAAFARETWNACRFQSPFFVKAFFPENNSPHYYVMEYVEAPSLSFLLKSKRLGVGEGIELGKFLCNACQWLLRHELIHGDIKSENILIFRTGDGLGYKLLDLGLASPVFTDSGLAGTPSYLAPERFAGAMTTECSEIFSIGVTLYEMLAGKLPYGSIERFQKPQFAPPRRLSDFNPDVPPWLDAVLFKAIAIKPERRYQHFTELLYALDHPESAPTEILEWEPLFTSNPLLCYKIGFWLFFCLSLFLLIKLFLKS